VHRRARGEFLEEPAVNRGSFQNLSLPAMFPDSAIREPKMLTEADIVSHAAKIRGDGFTVIEGAASPALVEGLKRAVERIEREHDLGPAKTSFEGFKTLRINNLLIYDEIFWEVPLHDNVLPVVERVLDRECLL